MEKIYGKHLAIIFFVVSIGFNHSKLLAQDGRTFQATKYVFTGEIARKIGQAINAINKDSDIIKFKVDSAEIYIFYTERRTIEGGLKIDDNDIIIAIGKKDGKPTNIGIRASVVNKQAYLDEDIYGKKIIPDSLNKYVLIDISAIDKTINFRYNEKTSQLYAKIVNPLKNKKYAQLKFKSIDEQIDIGLDSTRVAQHKQIFTLADDKKDSNSVTVKYRSDTIVPDQLFSSDSLKINLRQQTADIVIYPTKPRKPADDSEKSVEANNGFPLNFENMQPIVFYTDTSDSELRKINFYTIDADTVRKDSSGYVYAYPAVDITPPEALIIADTDLIDSALAKAKKPKKLRWLFSLPAFLLVAAFAL